MPLWVLFLLVFIAGLVLEVTVVKRIGAPLMGVSILLGLATIAMRLRASDLRATEEA